MTVQIREPFLSDAIKATEGTSMLAEKFPIFALPRRADRPRFCRDGCARFLRAAFPAGTALNVAGLTGISASTVDNWLRGVTAPSADHLAILFTVFGKPFLSACYPVAAPWVKGNADHERMQDAITELQAAIEAVLSRQN